MRPLVIELNFQKNQKTLFKTVNFAGYLGVLTGMKPKKFSLTVNERFKLNGGYIGVVEWIIGLRNQQWMGFLTRNVMENADTYLEAQKLLAKTPLVSPVYFILSGAKPFQGCIITRGRNKFDIKALNPSEQWFLVQTNYDHWEKPPFYDDRRKPATTCLTAQGNTDLISTLFNVLSTRPVFNKLTVYTTIMQNNEGQMMTWVQECKDPCWPW
ncbi:hypothetical protein B566_EDAN012369 [Ephemera danica]|nr:hypothetical protein B566_EDAN012369 [Ephemera danica]